MKTLPTTHQLMAESVKRGNNINLVAKVFSVCRQIVSKWVRDKARVGMLRYYDKPREPKQSKITIKVELSILAMRTTFK